MSLLKENIERIKEVMGINEVRSGVINYIKDKLPHFPHYVIRDLVARNVISRDEKLYLDKFIEWQKPIKWRLEKDVNINMNFFNEETQKRLMKRVGGEIWNFIPKDEERHEIQKNKLESEGLGEPIIVLKFKDTDGVELLEGWHRTTQMFKKYPNGYVYPNVYFGYYPGTQEQYGIEGFRLFPDFKEAVGKSDSIYKFIDG